MKEGWEIVRPIIQMFIIFVLLLFGMLITAARETEAPQPTVVSADHYWI